MNYPNGTGPNDIKKWLSYNKKTGIFKWKKERTGRYKNGVKIGSIAGSINNQGYMRAYHEHILSR